MGRELLYSRKEIPDERTLLLEDQRQRLDTWRPQKE